jgi:hypothetical protein
MRTLFLLVKFGFVCSKNAEIRSVGPNRVAPLRSMRPRIASLPQVANGLHPRRPYGACAVAIRPAKIKRSAPDRESPGSEEKPINGRRAASATESDLATGLSAPGGARARRPRLSLTMSSRRRVGRAGTAPRSFRAPDRDHADASDPTWSDPTGSHAAALEAAGGQQFADPLARIEHAGLHRVRRDPDDLGDILDRARVIVDEIDDLAVRRGQQLKTVS